MTILLGNESPLNVNYVNLATKGPEGKAVKQKVIFDHGCVCGYRTTIAI